MPRAVASPTTSTPGATRCSRKARSRSGRRVRDRPLPVGTTPPNGYGLYHMGENVHEWCTDWYDARGYIEPPLDPEGEAPEGTRRASRGGSWRHRVKVSRIAARSSLAPDRQYNDYGFRVYADGG